MKGYVFTWTDMVGMPPLLTAAAGNNIYYYVDSKLVARGETDGGPGEYEIIEDIGLRQAQPLFSIQGAVVSESLIQEFLEDSPASDYGLDANTSSTAEVEDCPWWIITMACGTCIACTGAPVVAPTCLGACATCVGCIVVSVPDPGPNPEPRPRPYPCVTYPIETLVHTPSGLVEIQTLTEGSEIYTANAKGCLLYTSPSPRDQRGSRMPSSA